MIEIKTHKKIAGYLCGIPLKLEPGYSMVKLETSEEMKADEKGLVHGGFLFGLADYAAMIAVNDPHVVLGSSEVKFKKPVKAGEIVIAEAKVTKSEKNKRFVDVSIKKDTTVVFEGSFLCFILERHVLDI